MDKNKPIVSIIIPTYNRSVSLRRTLDALCIQTYPLEQIEVIVVADGCTDGTMEMLQHYRAPFTMRFINQTNQGAAAARNHGATNAMGQILLFLDDDVEPIPSLIESHTRAHQCWPGHVIIGYYPPVFQGPVDFFRIELRTWWEAKFHAMRQPGHRYTYSDLLSGNFSIGAELFTSVGGFNPAFSCHHEDYEFGVRLIKAGIPFTFIGDALGYHHETSDLDRSLQRKYQEGRADVLMGRCHPELRPILPLAHLKAYHPLLMYILYTIIFRLPEIGNLVITRIPPVLNLLERARLRRRWRQIFRALCYYWYWRGVAKELSTQQALYDFLEDGLIHANRSGPEIEIDLCEGLEMAERRLDESRPAGIRLHYGKQPVGRIPPQPGAEQLRGVHLRIILATDLAWPLLKALALEETIGRAINAGPGQPLTSSTTQPFGAINVKEGY